MLSVGLVGLPNAGKSTLFNLLTKNSVPAENFPFCTIDPSDGIIEVYDERVVTLAKLYNSKKNIFSAIEFRDIAGLIKGASSGAGLGNKFLSHIREVDLILMVVRAFENNDIIHVENRVNPQEDADILIMELTISDAEQIKKAVVRLEKEAKTGKDKFATEKLEICKRILEKLENCEVSSSYILPQDTDKEIVKWRKSLNLLTDKKIIKLSNISLDNPNKDFASDIQIDIATEIFATDLNPEEREELGMERISGIHKLIKKCFQELNLASYLTVGEVESRAWTFEKGSNAAECAGIIHSDFEKKFIKADIIKFDDIVKYGSKKSCAENGKVQTVGREYIMQDGDVVEFKTGA